MGSQGEWDRGCRGAQPSRSTSFSSRRLFLVIRGLAQASEATGVTEPTSMAPTGKRGREGKGISNAAGRHSPSAKVNSA